MPFEYRQIAGFDRDLKRLQRKFRTLSEDLEVAKLAAIELYHLLRIDNHSVFPVPGLQAPGVQIFKLKKFACRALKGRGVHSGIRVIYALHEASALVVLLEMYFKADQADLDLQRARKYLAELVD